MIFHDLRIVPYKEEPLDVTQALIVRWVEGIVAAGLSIGLLIWTLLPVDAQLKKALQADSTIRNGELTIKMRAKPHEQAR